MPVLILGLVLSLLVWFPSTPGLAESGAFSQDDPHSLDTKFERLRSEGSAISTDPEQLIELASLYLDIADERYTDHNDRITAYERGAAAAERALALDETNARAHFLYAANKGRAAQLNGIVASAFSVLDIKAHTARALELRPDYAPALHMMGRLLDELPWFFGGDEEAALEYLERAVEVKPGYAHARLDLAKAYLDRGRVAEAKRHLEVLAGSSGPSSNHASADTYRVEAKRLLKRLTEPVKKP